MNFITLPSKDQTALLNLDHVLAILPSGPDMYEIYLDSLHVDGTPKSARQGRVLIEDNTAEEILNRLSTSHGQMMAGGLRMFKDKQGKRHIININAVSFLLPQGESWSRLYLRNYHVSANDSATEMGAVNIPASVGEALVALFQIDTDKD
jgi:hypothetical protein